MQIINNDKNNSLIRRTLCYVRFQKKITINLCSNKSITILKLNNFVTTKKQFKCFKISSFCCFVILMKFWADFDHRLDDQVNHSVLVLFCNFDELLGWFWRPTRWSGWSWRPCELQPIGSSSQSCSRCQLGFWKKFYYQLNLSSNF